jgi:hypothetical protein
VITYSYHILTHNIARVVHNSSFSLSFFYPSLFVGSFIYIHCVSPFFLYRMNKLPIELFISVFTHASACPHEKTRKTRQISCMCSQIELLNISMVCSSWHRIASSIMTSPWPLLVNFPGIRRTYPYRHRISQLLQESKRLNLDFHRHVNQLVLDFSSLDLKGKKSTHRPTARIHTHTTVH